MEVACNVACLRSVKSMPRISFWDSRQLGLLNTREQDELRYIIDKMGLLSAQAQHLRVPITDYNRLRTGNHSLYLCTTGIPGKPDFILVKGMLKVGVKNLYIRKDNGQLVEMAPLCVLDFYVHENHQRLGLGHELFEAMLQREKKRPHELGSIDRPSTKLHAFMAKYYRLTEYLPQANQFVIFKNYFGEQQQDGSTDGKQAPVSGWTNQEKQSESAFLLDNNKRDKVLHGRRANHASEGTDSGMLPAGKLMEDGKSNPGTPITTNACAGYHLHGLRPGSGLGRRHCPSRQQVEQANNGNANEDNVDCIPADSMETKRNSERKSSRSSRSPLPSTERAGERDSTIKSRYRDIGQQMLSSNQDSKLGRGRRNGPSIQNECTEAKRRNDRTYMHMRYPSPPRLPVPLEEPKEESFYNPTKLPRRETTRDRLFHEDLQTRPQNSSKPSAPLKCPYWTEDPQIFDTKHYDRNAKITLTPLPPSFQMTRSCYHAGMQGCGAAEAMGYHNYRAVR